MHGSIQNLMALFKTVSVTAYNKLGMDGIRGEGYAEFFKDYVSDRAKAKREFQNFIATLRKQLRMNQN